MNTTNNTTDVAKNNCNVLLSSIKLLQRSLFGLSSNFWIFEKFRLSSLFWAFGLRLLQLILLNNTTNVAKSDILTIYCHPLKGKIIPFPDLGFFCNKKSQLFWKSCNFLIFWSWIENFISRNTYCSRSLHFWPPPCHPTTLGVPPWLMNLPYSPTFNKKLQPYKFILQNK